MATYAIGDIQGCFSQLKKLLKHIQFDDAHDSLWFAGDIINRGSESLETIRFIKNLGSRHKVVLGNHDLHFLAVAHGVHPGWKEDTFNDILTAPDRKELVAWLQNQPLMYHDSHLHFTMAHAGIAPQWELMQAVALSKEVEAMLKSEHANTFLEVMYGNLPDLWHDDLTGWDRLRCITNYFTRMRLCDTEGRIDLTYKGTLAAAPQHLLPWYNVPYRKNAEDNIAFGHWAALSGITNTANTFALDTGCVWGYELTALRLEDQQRFSVAWDN
jgi:bis(5'-nucleosyl)-tetraphosphatase (symmetrical)